MLMPSGAGLMIPGSDQPIRCVPATLNAHHAVGASITTMAGEGPSARHSRRCCCPRRLPPDAGGDGRKILRSPWSARLEPGLPLGDRRYPSLFRGRSSRRASVSRRWRAIDPTVARRSANNSHVSSLQIGNIDVVVGVGGRSARRHAVAGDPSRPGEQPRSPSGPCFRSRSSEKRIAKSWWMPN